MQGSICFTLLPLGRMYPACPRSIRSWSSSLHHVVSEDGYSAGFQQPSAPLDGASLDAHTESSDRQSHPDTCGIRTADPCPLARTLPPLGRWSGSFSHGVSFLGRETKDQPFNSYRCHPRGVFTGPYLLRRPYHPQKPASQTLRLQGAPCGASSYGLARMPLHDP